MDETARLSLTRFEHFSSALLDEVEARSADDAVHSALWPTVGAVAGHVTAVYRWVTTILRTGSPADRAESPLDGGIKTTVLRDARTALLAELERDDRECWVIGGGTGTTAFWRRRMVLETLKHLLDVRTSPAERFAVPEELDPELAADGIDEFLKVFLGRSRSSLDPLPGSVFLTATDTDRAWALAADWSLGERGGLGLVADDHSAREATPHPPRRSRRPRRSSCSSCGSARAPSSSPTASASRATPPSCVRSRALRSTPDGGVRRSTRQPWTRRPATHVPTQRVEWMLSAGPAKGSRSVAARSATAPTSMMPVTSVSPGPRPLIHAEPAV